MPVIGSRNTKINTAEKQAAYNLHYVNIALGIYFWRAFLYPEGSAQLLPVLFLPLKNQSTQKQKPACAASASATKTMTKINAEGTARGESKRGTVAGTVEFFERGNIPH